MAIYKTIPRLAYPLLLALLWLAAGTAAAQPSDFERFAATFRELPDGPLPDFGQWSTQRDTLVPAQFLLFFIKPFQTACLQNEFAKQFEDQLPCDLSTENVEMTPEWYRAAKIGKRSIGDNILLFYGYSGPITDPNILAILYTSTGKMLDILVVSGVCGPCILNYSYSGDVQRSTDGAITICREGHRGSQTYVAWPNDSSPNMNPTIEIREYFSVSSMGHFLLDSSFQNTLHGVFRDTSTNEEIAIEGRGPTSGPRAAYRANARKPWSFPAITHTDRPGRSLTIRFSNSPTTYRLVQSHDGQTLTSTGSDGSAPQVFRRVRAAP